MNYGKFESSKNHLLNGDSTLCKVLKVKGRDILGCEALRSEVDLLE